MANYKAASKDFLINSAKLKKSLMTIEMSLMHLNIILNNAVAQCTLQAIATAYGHVLMQINLFAWISDICRKLSKIGEGATAH